MTAPLVAIVTPVYNGAQFLAETLESVQSQTYSNIVHVLLDNASTDSTPAIIASYQESKVPLVVSHNDKLLSMIDNWNRAIGLVPAEAAHFMVLCADDVLKPDAIERMVAIAESDPAIMAVTTAVYWNDKTKDFGWPKDRTVYPGDEVVRLYFKQEGHLDTRIMMFRRAALDSAKPFYDSTLDYSEDLDAALRAITAGKMGFVHEPVVMVREHEGNISNTTMRPLRMHYFDWLIIMQRYGPAAFGAAPHRDLYRRYKRYYYRQLLLWRWRDNNKKAYDLHISKLEGLGERPTARDYLDSAIDLVLKRMGLRPGVVFISRLARL